MTTAKTKLLTADELLRLNSQGVRGELIRGVLHETMPVGKIHSKVVAKLVYLLMAFVLPRRLGTVMESAGVGSASEHSRDRRVSRRRRLDYAL